MLKCLLSPDVRQLATTSADKTIKLWNLDGFTLDRTLVGAALVAAGMHAVLADRAVWNLDGFRVASALVNVCRFESAEEVKM